MRAKTMEGREINLKQDTLDTLRMRLRWPMFALGDADYDQSRTVWNGMIDREPAVVVRCLGIADVIACVEFARENELQRLAEVKSRWEPQNVFRVNRNIKPA